MNEPKMFTREELCTAAAEVWTKTMFQTTGPEKVINISVALMQLMGHVYDNYGKTVEDMTEHDRQIAEKAYREGYSDGWYHGWDDDGDNNCHDNPYQKDKGKEATQ